MEVVPAIFLAYIGTKVSFISSGGPDHSVGPPSEWCQLPRSRQRGGMSPRCRVAPQASSPQPTAARLRFASWNAAVTVAEIRPRSETV